MNDESLQLLWDVLWRTEGDIPWSAMEAFAGALAGDPKRDTLGAERRCASGRLGTPAEPDLIDQLFDAYDKAREAVLDRTCYVHLYVPAILALATTKLDERRRQEIGESLIARLVEAGEQDDHLMMEILVAACGAMGPVILPMVFGVVIDEAASSGAWDQLWGLTKLAVGSGETLQNRVVAACVALLERVGRDEAECELGIEAAWTLASLGRVEQVELLRRLELRSRWTLAYADYNGARRALEEHRDSPFPQELWELPVRDWFEPRWQRTRDWLVLRDSAARTWEVPQATYAADPSPARIPIVEHSPRPGRKESCYAAIR